MPERKALLLANLDGDVGRLLHDFFFVAELVQPCTEVISERHSERVARKGICGFERNLHPPPRLIRIAERPQHESFVRADRDSGIGAAVLIDQRVMLRRVVHCAAAGKI